ncbi:MAG: alcohol dehydrogenase catalytic domain-containing protein [Clostridiaceae bacterium]|nr:alcohol dehydrogenase catalytic domain-containing protein [Clostridiaceae bacterium]
MKAAIVRAANQLSIEDIPLPAVNDYAAFCRILYGATCTATDQHIISHTVIQTPYPTLLGHESIGKVLEIGKKVRHYKVGDRVTNAGMPPIPALGLHSFGGGYAEYGLVFDHAAMRADGLSEQEMLRFTVGPRVPSAVIPEDIPDTVAPLLITWRETHSYIQRMGLKEGLRVLVIGSGGNGLSFMAHARAAAAQQIIAVGSANRADLARSCGADDAFDYRDDALADRLRTAARTGFHLLVDAIGTAGQMDRYLPFAAADAVVGIYGIEGRRNMTLNPFAAPHSFRFYHDGYKEIEAHEAVIRSIRAGFLKADLFYPMDKPYLLDDLQAAFAMLRRKEHPKALIQMHSGQP